MTVTPLGEQHLEFLNLKGGCIGSSESTLVKMSYCWKSHVTAHLFISFSSPESLAHGGYCDRWMSVVRRQQLLQRTSFP